MRSPPLLSLAAVTAVVLITWRIFLDCCTVDVPTKAGHIHRLRRTDRIESILDTLSDATSLELKCGLSRECPDDHFAVAIRSGVANVIGPRICFDGKILMSHVMNNVGQGLNMVLVDDENGIVERKHLNMIYGNSKAILEYLMRIKPGVIVLAASFEDLSPKMTKEIRKVFVRMGSTLIESVKHRDNWVFAARAGTENGSLLEKQAVNDELTNLYKGWPHVVEVGGCFPKT